MQAKRDVVIVGAGPYGLSLAAHLNDAGVDFDIYGEPMQFWRNHMPIGMQLKSDGFASNLYEPRKSYTLRRYCEEGGLNYNDTTLPIDLDTFVNYGLAFQKRFVPDLKMINVSTIEKISDGFSVCLGDGNRVVARTVVLATGISHFRHIPAALQSLSKQYVTHSTEHHDLAAFKDRQVVVLGAGASATDLAALLFENGAQVRLLAREHIVRFHTRGDDRSVIQKLRHPSSGIGPGLRTRFYCDAPWLFRYLPEQLRLLIVDRTLGPAGGWFMKDRVIGRFPVLGGCSLESAEVKHGKVHLSVRNSSGALDELAADHVIAATGFKMDLRQFDLLSKQIRSELRTVNNTPVLSRSLESSVSDLYFMGAITANCFGPVMRFAFGARYAAPRIARALVARGS